MPSTLAANVSWRNEPGVSRAYTWLDDGTVVGYRDLVTGIDQPASADWVDLLKVSVESWLATYGVPHARIGPEREPFVIPPRDGGFRNRWRRRKALRQDAVNRQAWARWWLDHPTWRGPIDPPHGGWRDLVRNEAGDALWRRAASLPTPGFFDHAGRHELRAWRTGALGEETVARDLWQLSRNGLWRHLHSVPVGTHGSDIDHILVGPGGVFTLNTKNHCGANIWVDSNTFMVNGQKQPYLRNSRHEAERASKLLTRACGFPVPVYAVVVVVDPRNLTIRQDPTDVAITTRRRLKSWISTQPNLLEQTQADAIFDQARRSSTWTAARGT
ncbi:hypothetical protein JCM18899A_44260 [Nocardioides sp. AN3]